MSPLETVLRLAGYGQPLLRECQTTFPPWMQFFCLDPSGLDRILIIRYRAGDLTEDEQRQFLNHLAECEGCRKYLTWLERRWPQFFPIYQKWAAVEARNRSTPDT